MDIRKELGKMMGNPNFTKGEKRLIECQFPEISNPSNFIQKFITALFAADDNNLDKISSAFPEEVKALRDFRSGVLKVKMQKEGINLKG